MTKVQRPKISVVVPVYKVERYLRECLDSILTQTLRDIEVIIIDDGSPDGCGEIIDEYAKKDARVVSVHQKNAGYSKTVNLGIKMARGEYVGIIESDDWIEPRMYEELYNNAKALSTDITKGMFYIYDSTKNKRMQNKIYTNPSGVDLKNAPEGAFKIEEWPQLIAFHASIWSSIYRAEFIKKIKIPETAGASYQDFPFMIDLVIRAKRISVVKKPFVHWRNDPDQGNSTSANDKKLLLMAQNSQTGVETVRELGMYDVVKEALIVHVVWANVGFFYKIEKRYKKEYYLRLKKILEPVRKDRDFQYTLFTKADKKFFRLMTKKNWFFVKTHMFFGKIKHFLFG